MTNPKQTITYLQNLRAILEVSEALHDFAIDDLQRFLPFTVETPDKCCNSSCEKRKNKYLFYELNKLWYYTSQFLTADFCSWKTYQSSWYFDISFFSLYSIKTMRAFHTCDIVVLYWHPRQHTRLPPTHIHTPPLTHTLPSTHIHTQILHLFLLYSRSCCLNASISPLSIAVSASFTNDMMPPKCGERISSMNSWVRADNSSLKLSASFESSAVLSCKHKERAQIISTLSSLVLILTLICVMMVAHKEEVGGVVIQGTRQLTLGSQVQVPPRAFKGFEISATFLCECDYMSKWM